MVKINIKQKTKRRLAHFGYKTSTWDSILNDLMNHAESCDKWYEDRLL